MMSKVTECPVTVTYCRLSAFTLHCVYMFAAKHKSFLVFHQAR